ncbi:DM13 domain-containing protein [Streptomyces sp. NPDC057136]|uniref:DM13 domain-containing protein n=1 Tax=Streptomyces sp. NPDC057136 TaxID=3346029 RepID=UPI00363F9E9F
MARARRLFSRPVFQGVLIVAALAVGAGLYLFQPWKAWQDETVREEFPTAAGTPAAEEPRTAGWGVFDDGEHMSLGKLKGNMGYQNYALPSGIDLDRFSSVTIWCDRFNVSFGAAQLSRV